MDKACIINIYPIAQTDIENIFLYISKELCNPTTAFALIDKIKEALDLVSLDPFMCPLAENEYIKDKSVRKLIVEKYIIFYRVEKSKEEVQVLRVLYAMSDYDKLI